MTDIVDSKTRSRMMAAVAQKNTKPEVALRRLLHRSGLRFRLHDPGLPGRPDIVFPKYRAVIFVHGCFWHRHQRCSRTTTPKTRRGFWQQKFEENVRRDRKNVRELEESGWRVFVVWECEVLNDAQSMAKNLTARIKSGE